MNDMKQRGITLIELMVLVAIASILVSIALPILFVEPSTPSIQVQQPQTTNNDGPKAH